MSKRRFGLFSLVGLMMLLGCRPAESPVQATQTAEVVEIPTIDLVEEIRIVPEYNLLPYDVVISEELSQDLSEMVWFALQNDSAKELSEKDFDHCHVLIDRADYEAEFQTFYKDPAYRGTLSGWIDEVLAAYDGILCHTQELVSKPDPLKRNLLMWRSYEPYVVLPQIGEISVHPIDLDREVVGVLTFSFELVEEGEVFLSDGTELNVFINSPEIYTICTTPEKMRIDLPRE